MDYYRLKDVTGQFNFLVGALIIVTRRILGSRDIGAVYYFAKQPYAVMKAIAIGGKYVPLFNSFLSFCCFFG